MDVVKTIFDEAFIIEPTVFKDNRGFFFETYHQKKFDDLGLTYNFIQDNHSYSKHKNTVRGLHYQLDPMSQTTCMRVVSGAIMDVIVDLRKGSPTYKQHIKTELSEENKRVLLFGKGFAHGFLTLSDHVTILYKMDDFYSHEHDRTIVWNDPDLAIDWGVHHLPILSPKDQEAKTLAEMESEINFRYNFKQ